MKVFVALTAGVVAYLHADAQRGNSEVVGVPIADVWRFHYTTTSVGEADDVCKREIVANANEKGHGDSGLEWVVHRSARAKRRS